MTKKLNYITECEKYSNTIIPDICCLLDENNISYDLTSRGSEVIVRGKDKKEILSMMGQLNKLPKPVFSALIGITRAGECVYIRQKYKN